MIRGTQRGFTLIELLLVLVILSILAAVVVPVLIKRPDQARRSGTITDIKQLKTVLTSFYLDNGRYPTTDEGLEALVTMPPSLAETWKGSYIEQVLPDKWGRAYWYIYPSQENPEEYFLFSVGRDGQEYTPDDITRYTVN